MMRHEHAGCKVPGSARDAVGSCLLRYSVAGERDCPRLIGEPMGRPSTTVATSSHDSLGAYLRPMAQIPLLTREGEYELARRIELADHTTRRAVLSCDVGLEA